MTLGELFKTINQLNNIYSKLGVNTQYELKFSGEHSYENLDCFDNKYKNYNDFKKAVEEESYFTDMDTAILDSQDTPNSITDTEYKTTFNGITNGTHEKVSQVVYVYIIEE